MTVLDQTSPLQTPILLIMFNRPDTAARVLDVIRQAKPRQLFVAVDGPRKTHPKDAEACAQTRALIETIDWDCEVKTRFPEENQGCAKAVSSAITWFFEQVEAGIILEDDCLPHPSFFSFCQHALEEYKNDTRVMHISGSNFQFGKIRGDGSYYYSKEALIWGWATWRRAWQYYDLSMSSYPQFESTHQFKNLYEDWLIRFYKSYHFRKVRTIAPNSTWDFAWSYTVYTQGGLCITPNVNLISNIGFGGGSTHTTHTSDPLSNLPSQPMLQMVRPTFMIADKEADLYTMRYALKYSWGGILSKIRIKLMPGQ